MTDNKIFDVLIIGGSYAGLSAAMALGRALKNILIIDNGKPCNSQTPHSHNFITQDGKTPKEISTLARQQVEKYTTVNFYNGLAVSGKKTARGFEITTEKKETFSAKKIIFATGVKDIMPDLEGFSDCWGISVIHCPYCHGYEYKSEKTGILANGEIAFEMAKMIRNWTTDLTIFTNGASTLTKEQTKKLESHQIKIIATEINNLEHTKGYLKSIEFKDETSLKITALYARPKFEQHCSIPEALGCSITENNMIQTDLFQKTTVPGVFACGDNNTMMRSVANAVAMGGLAGVMASKELFEEEF